jgi:hypothetical protein
LLAADYRQPVARGQNCGRLFITNTVDYRVMIAGC